MLELLIIGSSAAGASAGIYAARRNLNFKIVAVETGGEVATSGEIANYPAFGETDGITLSEKFQEHLKTYSIDTETDIKVTKIKKIDGHFAVTGDKLGQVVKYETKSVMVTTGVHPRELNIAGEKAYRGKGLTYCTTCDGPLYKDKVVVTIGGGNSALESALMLKEIAAKVTIINKNTEFKGDTVLIDKVRKSDKIDVVYGAMTTEVTGAEFVKGLKYKGKDGKEQELATQGVFVHIGMVPNSDFVSAGVEKNDFGEIKVNQKCETSVPGFFAAGDVTDVPYKQIGIAVGQGICAALSAVEYLNKLES